LAERLRRLRNYGQQQKYEHTEKGLNARLDSVQAAILNVKLKYLNGWNEDRGRHAEAYRSRLEGAEDLRLQTRSAYSTHVYHLFIVETEQRDGLQQYLERQGIQTNIHYPKPIHLQKAYADLGYERGDFPESEKLAAQMLSLPMFPELTEQQIGFVCDNIAMFLYKCRRTRTAAVCS